MGQSTSTEPPRDLAGKVAVVTGATSGIGLETAKALAHRGAHVILACRRPEAASRVCDEIRGARTDVKIEVGPKLDVGDQACVRAFAKDLAKAHKKIDILVNNAGTNAEKGEEWYTPDGVGGLAQINYLGPYTLTRLLEPTLLASAPCRVVNVASVTHRFAFIKSAEDFLMKFKYGQYAHTKLANVLFAYELQRRLGPRGVQSCAVDPGGVRTNIWSTRESLSKGPIKAVINACYAPPADGAQAVIHAATCDWDADAPTGRHAVAGPENDLRYYARGTFAWPATTSVPGAGSRGILGAVMGGVQAWSILNMSLVDWPLRAATGGRVAGTTKAVRSAKITYDERLAKELWDRSARIAGVP
ncbi:unnamed protein product [Pedinophyceae sp. YPF-701]|nr:unnamed protein product [Pedinophyceae sp. YPF-701]